MAYVCMDSLACTHVDTLTHSLMIKLRARVCAGMIQTSWGRGTGEQAGEGVSG
jgi:hypothetical protein